MLSREEIEKAKRICRLLCGKKNKKGKREYEMFARMQMEIDYTVDEMAEAIDTLLQYNNQLEQENNKQNKIIEEMALAIASYDIDEEICKNQVMPLCDKSSLEVTVDVCAKCLKQYFEEKVEGE